MWNEFQHQFHCMGSAFELIVVVEKEEEAKYYFEIAIKELVRIESLLTEYKSGSETWRINNHPHPLITDIEPEVFQLITRCLGLSKISHGCFDITIGPLKKLYTFHKNHGEFPTSKAIQDALKIVGFEKLQLGPGNTIVKTKKEMEISFAAIGKGYAADRVRSLWKKMGCFGGVINASGDLCTIGYRADGRDWTVGIPHPDKQRFLFQSKMPTVAVATSGNYEQYFSKNKIKYGHTLHPKTGLPVTGIQSASIFSPSAELSDALATAITVMDIRNAIQFINQLPDTYCLFLDQNEKIYSNIPSQTAD